MHVVIDAQPDPSRYADAFRYVLRGAYRRVRMIGAILVALGLLIVAVSVGDGLWPMGVAFVALGLLYVFYVPWRSIRVGIRRLPPVLLQPSRIELTEQGVSMVTPLMSAQYAWAAFVGTAEYKGQLLLLLSKRQVAPVPLAGVPQEQLDELRRVLADRAFARR